MPSTSATGTVKAVADHGEMKVIDLVKNDNMMTKCLVEYTDTRTRKWIAADDIRKSNPRLLIDYYESRIQVVQQKR